MNMSICVISPGVVHAVPRTIAIASHFPEVHFIDLKSNSNSGGLASKNITVHKLPRWGKSLFAYFDLLNLLHKIRPDAIICHFASGQHFFLATVYGKCPVVAICMGHDILFDEGDSYVPFFMRLLTKLALKQAAYICAKSKFLATRIESFGVNKSIDINYWGCDLSIFQPQARNLAREKLHIRKDATIILSPRAVEPRLNIHLIVEAFASVREKMANVELIILGRASASYKVEIDKLIKDLELGEHVHLVYEVEQKRLPDYYNASDLVVSMASSEGFPNTLLEVMGCGIPVLAGKIPQTSELLIHKTNAYLCDLTSVAITQNIIEILKNPKIIKEVTINALQLAQNKADIMKNGEIFSDKLKSVIKTYQRTSQLVRIKFALLFLIHLIINKISPRLY